MSRFLLFAAAFFSFSMMAGAAAGQGVYHRQDCPHADPSRMVLMPRVEAEARGFVPAADCYRTSHQAPVAAGHTWRYLGESGAGASVDTATAKTQHVNAYTRSDGTHVDEYYRSAPQRH